MGQKTHPKGFRLISTQNHLSTWYTAKNNYAKLLEEDNFLRINIKKILINFLILADINIERIINSENKTEYIKITLNAAYPKFKESYLNILKHFNDTLYNIKLNKIETITKTNQAKQFFENIIKDYKLSNIEIKNYFILILLYKIRNLIRLFKKKTNKTYFISINLFKNIFENVSLIANYICKQLEQRISFKKIIKETIALIKDTNSNIKGIKIQISGRLNDNSIARTEWEKDSSMPLHTLFANINYSSQTAKTKYGLLGVKVWLYTKD